jgi:hypothetical protein
MSAIQSWHGLPEHFKPQAALDMLRGVQWHFWGIPIANPGRRNCRAGSLNLSGNLWVCSKEEIIGNLKKTNPAPEKRQIVTPTLTKTPPPVFTSWNSSRAVSQMLAAQADARVTIQACCLRDARP